MGNPLESGWLRRKLLLNMASPTMVIQLESVSRDVFEWKFSLINLMTGMPARYGWKDKKTKLTGPIMVACQWNCR
jgi:hypothetical protein